MFSLDVRDLMIGSLSGQYIDDHACPQQISDPCAGLSFSCRCSMVTCGSGSGGVVETADAYQNF